MPEPLRLHTTLVPRGPAAAIVLTDEQVAELTGGAKVAPVRVTINCHTLRLRLARMGGDALIGFSRAARTEAGVEPGEEVDVEIALDDAPREVEVPPDLAAAFADDAGARDAFDGLAFTHRKEFAQWVAEAKRAETRERRVAETLRMLRQGRTRS
jgi:Bacteriocin-protection, YdeI or OmpD-Associated/Domain of unknown function (DUF1905)